MKTSMILLEIGNADTECPEKTLKIRMFLHANMWHKLPKKNKSMKTTGSQWKQQVCVFVGHEPVKSIEFLKKNNSWYICRIWVRIFFLVYRLFSFVSSDSPPVRPFRCFGFRLTELLGLVPAVPFVFLQAPFQTGNQSFKGSENIVSQGFKQQQMVIWSMNLRINLQSNLRRLIVRKYITVLETIPVWWFQFIDIILLGAGCCDAPGCWNEGNATGKGSVSISWSRLLLAISASLVGFLKYYLCLFISFCVR